MASTRLLAKVESETITTGPSSAVVKDSASQCGSAISLIAQACPIPQVMITPTIVSIPIANGVRSSTNTTGAIGVTISAARARVSTSSISKRPNTMP